MLASASLVAIYLEPSTPARYQQGTYGLLIAYTVYAAVAVLYAWHAAVPTVRWRLLSHAGDLLLFSLIVYLTEGPASPFFLYFVFSLFCATLRFHWRGILATATAAMAIYGAMAIVSSRSDPDFELSRVLIRQAYLAVTAALLVYLGLYHQRLRRELASLAAWPRDLAADVEAVLRDALFHAASVVRVRRVLLMWEEREEPWQYLATIDGAEFRLERVAPGTIEFVRSEQSRDASFFIRRNGPVVVYEAAGADVSVRGPVAEDARLLERCGTSSAVVAAMASETIEAQFVVADARSATIDDLALTHIVGRLVLASLEQFFFLQQVRQNASAEERLRISRELHDGIVQSLGGVGLQLEALRTRLADDDTAAGRLAHVQRVIEHDQRELRTLVRELRPHDGRSGSVILRDELRRMTERFALEWGLEVRVDGSAENGLPGRLAHELARLVNEALSNAARHGRSTLASIRIDARPEAIAIRITDNGCGFPFTGRFDLEELTRRDDGPRTLKERVAALGGSLTIDSSAQGASVEVTIPFGEKGDR